MGNSHGIDIEKTIDTEFQPIPEPTSWAHKDFEGSWNTNYNRKICLFLKYFYAIDWEGMSYDEFVANHQILYPDGLGFKLNLLPVRFRNRESLAWAKAIEAASGFETFDDYRSWCVTHRGAVFRAAPLCCVISTLGGNTGSGASPVVARLARDMQLRCLTIATTPFAWESEQRHRNARAALSMLEQQAAQVDLIRLDDHMSGNEHEPFDAILDRVTAAAMKRIDAAAPPA